MVKEMLYKLNRYIYRKWIFKNIVDFDRSHPTVI